MADNKRTKRYEELSLFDDFLFCKIMENNTDLCKELTEAIIGRKIGKIISMSEQKPVEITADGRGVRFDVYMEDDESTVYDIEMQTYEEKELPKRTRYYQGMIDLHTMERGAKFGELKKSYIVFICMKNPFKEYGLHKYDMRTVCLQDQAVPFDDGSHKIILSAEGDKDDVSANLAAFLQYLVTRRPDSDLTRRLDEKVQESRGHEKWRMEYMTLEERDQRMREEGRAEGREEGREEVWNSLTKLMSFLLENGLIEEAQKATCDKEYAGKLMEKYSIQ